MMVEKLPPYSPKLNPMENVWEEIREKFFPNLVFDSLDAVEINLEEALICLENNPNTVQSITGFDWIISNLLIAY
jgi:transposase